MMGEDDSRIRIGYVPENASWLWIMAVSLLKKKSSKISIRRKMQRAADDISYLEKILWVV